MHPIEQLRYVARASGADAGLLVQEAASALGVFRHDRPALVTAARRLLTRQPTVGPLWWMCSRLTISSDPWAEARAVVEELRSDRTDRELAHHLPDGAVVVFAGWPDTIVAALPRRGDVTALVVDVEGQAPAVVRRLDRADVAAEAIDPAHLAGAVGGADLVLVEAAAAGPAAALTDVGTLPLAATARALGKPVWLVTAVGRQLPEPYWQAIVERALTSQATPAWLAPYDVVSFGLVDQVVTTGGLLAPVDAARLAAPVASELLRLAG
jgi:hypothetical protein